MKGKLTRKQIYDIRGRLKARPRAEAMRRRTEYQRHQYEIQVQNEIARRIIERIG